MDQHQNCSHPNILGLANMSLLPQSGTPHHDHAKVIKVGEKGLKHGIVISEEEMKIRREIEREIERDLEEEIKGGIYQQALRLHRLYRHRNIIIKPREKSKKERLEVNITIKMEGPAKMEIKQTKKQPPPPVSFRPRTSQTVPEVKRLDWVKSLRSSAAPPVVRCRTRMSVPASDRCLCLRPN